MDTWTQAWQYAVVLAVTLWLVSYASVAMLMARARLVQPLPWPIRVLAWRRRAPTLSNPSAARLWWACIVGLQFVPVATVLAWWLGQSVVVRLEGVLFLVLEAGWFIYLRRWTTSPES